MIEFGHAGRPANPTVDRRSLSHLSGFARCSSAVLGLVAALAGTAPAWSADAPRFFVFPKAGQCSVMLDVSPLSDQFSNGDQATQAVKALGFWFAAQETQYKDRCPETAAIKLLAVRISTVDNYGRPDFANRENLFELSGKAEDFAFARGKIVGQAPSEADSKDVVDRLLKK